MSLWTLYFDGLCEPVNPGGLMCWGWIIRREGMTELRGSGNEPARASNTNNRAEYMGLGFGLHAAIDQIERGESCTGLHVYGDSKLVVEQVNERWAVRASSIRPLHARCQELLRGLPCPWFATWIPREQNAEADEISRQEYFKAAGKMPPQRQKAKA